MYSIFIETDQLYFLEICRSHGNYRTFPTNGLKMAEKGWVCFGFIF